MGGILVSSDELHKTAEDFSRASTESQAVLKLLEGSIARLEGQWSGATQELFYTSYEEWLQHAAGLAALLTAIARELRALAERIETADR